MFKIERASTGLFSWLKLRSLGALPSDLSEYVQPTIDLNRWLEKDNDDQVAETQTLVATPAAGLYAIYTQPKNWLVRNISARGFNLVAGDVCLPTVTVLLPGYAFPLVIANKNRWGSNAQMTGAAGENILADVNWDRPDIVLPAGTIWQHYASVATGTSQMSCHVSYVELS